MNKKQKWVRADKLQPGDRVQDAKGNIVTIKDVSQGIFPGSWIGANFDVWIGAAEDNQAWRLLLAARRTYDAARGVVRQERNSGAYFIVCLTSSSNCRPAFARTPGGGARRRGGNRSHGTVLSVCGGDAAARP